MGTRPGVLWVATGLDKCGLALYVKARWEAPSPDWQRARALLTLILPSSDDAEALINALIPRAQIASVGIECAGPQGARVKLYWRLSRPTSLDTLDISLLGDPAVREFLTLTVRDRLISLSGLVFSAGFLLSTGALHDVKVDVCAHCIHQPPAKWVEVIDDLVRRQGLEPPGMDDILMRRRAEMAFIGLGIDQAMNGRRRFYLRARMTMATGRNTTKLIKVGLRPQQLGVRSCPCGRRRRTPVGHREISARSGRGTPAPPDEPGPLAWWSKPPCDRFEVLSTLGGTCRLALCRHIWPDFNRYRIDRAREVT
jgi:hypothetical protein